MVTPDTKLIDPDIMVAKKMIVMNFKPFLISKI